VKTNELIFGLVLEIQAK